MTRMEDVVITAKTGTHPALPAVGHNAMTQVAPMPWPLMSLVQRLTIRQPGWSAVVEDMNRGQGSKGLTLTITALVPDSRGGGQIRIAHLFPVPPAAYNERSWQRWLFDRYCDVLRHEAAEQFDIDGRLPYAPLHAPGNDPYMVVEATEVEEHTDNQGRVTS